MSVKMCFRPAVFINLLMLVLISVLASFFTYIYVKQSYWEVGYNEGVIEAKVEILQSLSRNARLHKCQLNDVHGDVVRIFSVKTESLVVVQHGDGTVTWCVE